MTVLLTGGTGSFGQAFTEAYLKLNTQEPLRIYSRDEKKQADMKRKFDDPRLRWLIGDVRDRERLSNAARGCELIIHAAAMKRVEACEYNPSEAVKTNVTGTENVIAAAFDQGVGKAILISSDKACNPLNCYGKSKAVAESLWIQANIGGQTRFAAVRYGNVLGSRGSVIEVWRDQMVSGVITVTNPDATRFWLTLSQAVSNVMYVWAMMAGGEIVVPKLPAMRIADLADVIAPDAKREIVGLQSGEKLHEILITEDESRRTKEAERHYIIFPEMPFWSVYTTGDPVPVGWSYASNSTERLSPAELGKLLEVV